MRLSPLLFGVLWVCFLTLLPSAGADTILQYTSTPENFVSRNPGHTLVPNAKTNFQIGSRDSGNTLFILITEPATRANGGVSTLLYQLEFSAPFGTPLALGTYDYAGVFSTAKTPGFEFFGAQGISDPVLGQFHVTELTYDVTGRVISFAADFTEQDRNNADSCQGSIQYNSGQPQPPAPPPAVSVSATTSFSVIGGAPGVFTIRRTGATTAALPVSYTLSGKAVNGTDYQPLSGVATIKAGKATVGIRVRPLDTGVPGLKKVKLTLTAPLDGSYTVGGPGYDKVIISR